MLQSVHFQCRHLPNSCSVLAMHQLTEKADCVFPIENQVMVDVVALLTWLLEIKLFNSTLLLNTQYVSAVVKTQPASFCPPFPSLSLFIPLLPSYSQYFSFPSSLPSPITPFLPLPSPITLPPLS